MLLQCFNISSNFQPMRSTFLLDKNVSTCSLRAWAIALVTWMSAVFSSCKLPKEILLPVSNPAPLSSVEAPGGYPHKNSNNRREKKEKALGGRWNGCALSFPFWQAFPQHKEASAGEITHDLRHHLPWNVHTIKQLIKPTFNFSLKAALSWVYVKLKFGFKELKRDRKSVV